MKRIQSAMVALCLSFACFTANAADPICPNKFPDFINDVCWSCMFPFKLFGKQIIRGEGEDFSTDADASPFCACKEALTVGVPTAFWEMSYIVDVHTAPGCMPTLGGMKLPLPWAEQQYGTISSPAPTRKTAFRNSAYYVSPMMYLLQAVLDDSCSDRSAFDVGWTSEFDPTWADDELALIKMPIAYAFSNIAGVMAAGIDAAAALTGFPLNELFWQAGSLGPIYPITGNVTNHKSMDNTGQLLATRMLAEAHAMREMGDLFSKGAGRSYACEPGEPGCTSETSKQAMCAGSPGSMPPQLIMKKRQYKLQRLFPTPSTSKGLLGGCCTPIGRSTALRETNTQLPLEGYKDFGYAVFRKRDCCSGVVSPVTLK